MAPSPDWDPSMPRSTLSSNFSNYMASSLNGDTMQCPKRLSIRRCRRLSSSCKAQTSEDWVLRRRCRWIHTCRRCKTELTIRQDTNNNSGRTSKNHRSNPLDRQEVVKPKIRKGKLTQVLRAFWTEKLLTSHPAYSSEISNTRLRSKSLETLLSWPDLLVSLDWRLTQRQINQRDMGSACTLTLTSLHLRCAT